jgi:hypothetical protein
VLLTVESTTLRRTVERGIMPAAVRSENHDCSRDSIAARADAA